MTQKPPQQQVQQPNPQQQKQEAIPAPAPAPAPKTADQGPTHAAPDAAPPAKTP